VRNRRGLGWSLVDIAHGRKRGDVDGLGEVRALDEREAKVNSEAHECNDDGQADRKKYKDLRTLRFFIVGSPQVTNHHGRGGGRQAGPARGQVRDQILDTPPERPARIRQNQLGSERSAIQRITRESDGENIQRQSKAWNKLLARLRVRYGPFHSFGFANDKTGHGFLRLDDPRSLKDTPKLSNSSISVT
jgi:hypothetical protein